MSANNFTFTGVIIKERRGFSALCLELDVASQGLTIPQAKKALLEAVTLYLETAIESNLPYMRPVPLEEDPRRTNPRRVVKVLNLKVDLTVHAYA